MTEAYLNGLTVELHDAAPIFRCRRLGPYSKDTIGDDVRNVRALVSGLAEKRQLMDMRRSGETAGPEKLKLLIGQTRGEKAMLKQARETGAFKFQPLPRRHLAEKKCAVQLRARADAQGEKRNQNSSYWRERRDSRDLRRDRPAL